MFWKVMLPSASSGIMTSLKISLPFALVGVIFGEFLVSSKGLGYQLYAAGPDGPHRQGGGKTAALPAEVRRRSFYPVLVCRC